MSSTDHEDRIHTHQVKETHQRRKIHRLFSSSLCPLLIQSSAFRCRRVLIMASLTHGPLRRFKAEIRPRFCALWRAVTILSQENGATEGVFFLIYQQRNYTGNLEYPFGGAGIRRTIRSTLSYANQRHICLATECRGGKISHATELLHSTSPLMQLDERSTVSLTA